MGWAEAEFGGSLNFSPMAEEEQHHQKRQRRETQKYLLGEAPICGLPEEDFIVFPNTNLVDEWFAKTVRPSHEECVNETLRTAWQAEREMEVRVSYSSVKLVVTELENAAANLRDARKNWDNDAAPIIQACPWAQDNTGEHMYWYTKLIGHDRRWREAEKRFEDAAQAARNLGHFNVAAYEKEHRVVREISDDAKQTLSSAYRLVFHYPLQFVKILLAPEGDWDNDAASPSPAPPIEFYDRDKPYYWLTNFAPYRIEVNGLEFLTTEHYFQANKFMPLRPDLHEQVRHTTTPREAFMRARDPSFAPHVRTDWPKVKEEVMLTALRAKFSLSHPDNNLAKQLLETGDARLVEHTTNDKYWGDGGDGSGRNRLGDLLMQVRAELCLAKGK